MKFGISLTIDNRGGGDNTAEICSNMLVTARDLWHTHCSGGSRILERGEGDF